MAQPSIPSQSSPAPLGKLTFVDARSVWKHEAQLFTPWLRDHIDLLADVLGLEIELLQIDNSLPAPHFKIVAKPNPTKLIKYAAVVGAPTERVLKRKLFFEDLIERMRRLRPSLVGSRTSVGTQNWCWLASGKRGL